MTDSTNIAQRGEELRYYYQRLLGDPKLLCDPIVHEVSAIRPAETPCSLCDFQVSFVGV